MKKLTQILLIIGGLNWLLFGLLTRDLFSYLGGMETWVARIVYIVVGLSAVYMLFNLSNKRPMQQ